MRKVFDALTQAFRQNGGRLDEADYAQIVTRHATLFEESDTLYLLLQASGYPITRTLWGDYRLETCFTSYRKQRYCIVDIETNGSKPNTSQVIEIGAVLMEEGKIIDRMESFVACAFLPEYITKVTGIEPADLVGAPSLKQALGMLRELMGDAVFVAHNASFDYSFLDASFRRSGLGDIGNLRLCTIDLARRTFESERYGLAYLNEMLGLDTATHHRAYSDAYSAYRVLCKSFETVPESVRSTDELLRFATSSRKQRAAMKTKQPRQGKPSG
jgi:DNA polymerase-3 subunit epsilon